MTTQEQSHVTLRQDGSANLWQQALDSLDSGLKAILDFDNSSKHDILKKTLETVEQKKQLCLRKRWKFERNGRQVFVRDLLQKIIKWLDHFKAIGDIATQYDPLHASLPWAGIRFLLQVVISESNIFGSTVENLEILSRFITRHAILENVYLKRNSITNKEIEKSLIVLYAMILKFLAKAKKYFETSTAVRSLQSIFQPEEDGEIGRIIYHVDHQIPFVIRLSDASLLNRLEYLEQPIIRIADLISKHEIIQKTTRYREILDWLSPVPYSLHNKMISESRIPQIGNWLIKNFYFLKWNSSSESSMFLIQGPPGCGKTSLASIAVDYFQQDNEGQALSAPCAYFYCNKNVSEPARSEPREILCSILRQLSMNPGRKSVHSTIYNKFKARKAEAEREGFDIERLGIKDCTRLILEVIASDPATIIIDALDELPRLKRFELVNALKSISKDSENIVKIFITSRTDNQISSLLPSSSTIHISSGYNQDDMKIFVCHHIRLAIESHSLLNGRVSLELREHLEETLLYSVGGRFLLAELMINRLCEDVSENFGEDKVKQIIRRISRETLGTLYEEGYSKISSAEPKICNIAKNAFALLLYQRESLTASACLTAIQWGEPSPTNQLTLPELLGYCKNMILLDPHSNMLRFVHASAQEFLEMQPDMSPSRANEMIALNCLNMCMRGLKVNPLLDLRPTENFNQYSAMYWAVHLREAGQLKASSELQSLSRDFIFGGGKFSLSFLHWTKLAAKYSERLPLHHILRKPLQTVSSLTFTPIFAACTFGLLQILSIISSSNDFEVDQRNDVGHTALYLACKYGYPGLVDVLLCHDSNPNVSTGWYGNPLQAACAEGHQIVAQMLLKKGADPMFPGKYKDAIQASTIGGNEYITRMILEQGFDIGSQDKYDEILTGAAEAGHLHVAHHLQHNYRAYSQSKSSFHKAIDSAILKGELPALEMMLSETQNPVDILPPDCVATAALGGQNKAITFLLDNGMDIDHIGDFGCPLRAASIMGHTSTVELLLDRGAYIYTSGPLGDALQAAATRGYLAITRLLLQKFVAPNSSGGFYGDALQAAAHQGHIDVAKALLDAGANVRRQARFQDAFDAATEGGNEPILQLFLERGLDFGNRPRGARRKGYN